MNRAWWATVHGVAKSWTKLTDWPIYFHFFWCATNFLKMVWMLRLQLFHLHSHQQTKEEAKDVKFPFKKLLEIVHNTFIEEKHTIIFDIQVIPHQCWIALYSICNISLVNNRHFLQIFFFGVFLPKSIIFSNYDTVLYKKYCFFSFCSWIIVNIVGILRTS